MSATAGLALPQGEEGVDQEEQEEHPGVRRTEVRVVPGRVFTSSVMRGGVFWGHVWGKGRAETNENSRSREN